jgi:hypothetical protein
LADAIPTIQAIQEIQDRRAQASLTSEQVKELVYRATLDNEEAEDAQVEFLLKTMKTGATPDV